MLVLMIPYNVQHYEVVCVSSSCFSTINVQHYEFLKATLQDEGLDLHQYKEGFAFLFSQEFRV